MSLPFAPFEGAASIPTGFAEQARSLITVPAIDDDAPDELKERSKALAALVEKREKRLGKLDGSLRKLIEKPLETAGVWQGADAWREQLVDELAIELGLRRDAQALAEDHRDALQVLRRDAFAAAERAKTEIERKLIELGWRRRIDGVQDPSMIQPLFILSHPSVHATRARADELQRKVQDRSFAQSNAEAIAAVERKIVASRRKLAAV
jgi:hypothetical protein